jgi:CheY-like chemotaxis protein
MKILVIEDDEIQHELLAAIFKSLQVEPTFSLTGEAGLERLRSHFFDAVLLDMGLPGRSGVQVLRAIRDNPMTREMPVMVFTADKTKEMLLQCMRYGISDYIGKPFQINLFGQKIANLRRMLLFKKESGERGVEAKVVMERIPGVLKFVYGGAFGADSVAKTAQLYSPSLKSLTRNEEVLLNFSALPGLAEPQMETFTRLLSLFAPKRPLVVAGRSYGPLVEVMSDFESTLFITEDDALEHRQYR